MAWSSGVRGIQWPGQIYAMAWYMVLGVYNGVVKYMVVKYIGIWGYTMAWSSIWCIQWPGQVYGVRGMQWRGQVYGVRGIQWPGQVYGARGIQWRGQVYGVIQWPGYIRGICNGWSSIWC